MTTALLTYHTSDGHQCSTKTAMVGYVLEQIRRGNKSMFIFIRGCAVKNHAARAKALARALHEKRVSAVLHGNWNVMVEPSIPLSEAMHLFDLPRPAR
jgi:hypothetical protein